LTDDLDGEPSVVERKGVVLEQTVDAAFRGVTT
jgi:hypothetical protein